MLELLYRVNNADGLIVTGDIADQRFVSEHRSSRNKCYDGIRFEEVLVGYPGRWHQFGSREDLARRILTGRKV